MKKLYALFILTSWLGTIYAIDNQGIIPPSNDKLSVGYIITLDGKRLTGQIGEVSYSNIISNVEFVNDFGTPYQLRAELIRGFVFLQDNSLVEYESIYQDEFGCWAYLKVIERGEALTLFKAPELKTKYSTGNDILETQTFNTEEYWLQFQGEKAFRVSRLGFKNSLKRKLRHYPTLATQLGNTGLKYKDLAEIVRQINAIYKQQRRTI